MNEKETKIGKKIVFAVGDDNDDGGGSWPSSWPSCTDRFESY